MTEPKVTYMLERLDRTGYRRASYERMMQAVHVFEGVDGDEEANAVTYWFRRPRDEYELDAAREQRDERMGVIR